MLDRFVAALIRHRMPLLIVGAVVTGACIVPASRLTFDQSIESFYAPDDPHLRDYLDSKSLFGGDEFVVVAYAEPKLFDDAGRLLPEVGQRAREFAGKLATIPGVERDQVQNLADAMDVERFAFLEKQQMKLRELFRGALFGDDQQTTAVVLRLTPAKHAPVPRGETFAAIRRVATEHNPPAFVVGEPLQIHDMFRYVEVDGAVLGWASTALLVLIILLIFRSLRWVVLPMLVVHATLLWTKAILVASGMQLSMVSSMLNSLVSIIGIATCMHVTVRYQEHRVTLGRVDATRETLRELAPAVFWTCATTAAGFGAQLTSHVNPVQSFGIMMLIGTMLVLAAGAAVLPGGMLLGERGADPRPALAAGLLGRMMSRMIDWVEHHPVPTSLASVGLTLFALAGMFRLRVETDFSKNFRASSPIVQSLDFVETRLGGAGTWEASFSAPETLDIGFIDKVRRVSERLRELEADGKPQITKVVSLADGVDLIPLLPLSVRLNRMRRFQPEFETSLYNAERGRMRIVLRACERQPSEEKLRLIARAEEIAREEFPDAKATGLFVLLTFLIESLLGDQWVNFGLGSFMIVLLMTIAFHSLRIGLISLVPNLLPIALVIGTMGWIDLPINIATAMIASVSMGLTVDSSIHYFAGYQRARKQGLDFFAALRETHQGVGRALVYANLALILGFLVLSLSHFIPLVYFGSLVSVAMLGGLIGNLILLPLLMRWVRL
jgi:predicted RND superfamily exporter protein